MIGLSNIFLLAAETEHAEHAHELSLNAVELYRNGWFVLTNSGLFSILVAVLVILWAQLATRNIQAVPSGLQNFWEWMIEGLWNLLEGILGLELLKKTFWFFATIFIYIVASNWFGLIPGVGTIGWGERMESGHFLVTHPLIRGVNADLNMTAAMAIMFFGVWIIWAWQAHGGLGVVKHIFFPSTGMKGAMALVVGGIFFLVGFIEIVSILLRPVALSLRLYGNVYGGEVMLEKMFALMPAFSWLIPIPFYFLELLVGVVQGLVFCLLTAVFTALMCRHDESHGAEGHAHH